jgi:hypothetical protein
MLRDHLQTVRSILPMLSMGSPEAAAIGSKVERVLDGISDNLADAIDLALFGWEGSPSLLSELIGAVQPVIREWSRRHPEATIELLAAVRQVAAGASRSIGKVEDSVFDAHCNAGEK